MNRPSRHRASRALSAAVPLFAALAVAAPASAAAERVVTLKGYDAPGPAKYDKVRIVQQGPAKAKRVLILQPGTSASAAYFRPIAEDIVKRAKGWQVWSVERRENLLEDHSMLDRYKRGQATPQQLFDYYLGWLGNPEVTEHFQPPAAADVAFARSWGMKVAMEDLRRVVRLARKGGRKVVLGGHSLGGNMTVAYATWDFAGRPGAKDLSGLVLIDGGSGPGTKERPTPTPAEAKAELDKLAQEDPFLDLVGNGLTWSAGVFSLVGSSAAHRDPTSPSVLHGWPFLPDSLRPPVLTTNRAGYAYAIDVKTGPANLALVQQHLGRLADEGEPRDWIDGGLVKVARAARAFSGPVGLDGVAWYHPRRLTLDGRVTNGGTPTPAQKTLGVRTIHGKKVRMPIYAFEASLGKGRVLRGAQLLAKRSRVPKKQVTLVDRSSTYAHVDPLTADPRRNAFLKTVVPFLKRIK